MNKKVMSVVALFLFSLVGALFVVGQDQQCTEVSPCEIPSDGVITFVVGSYYTVADAPNFLARRSEGGSAGLDYFYNRETRRVEPALSAGDFARSYPVIDVDDTSMAYHVLFTSANTPQSHAVSRAENLPTPDQLLIQLPDRSEHPMIEALEEFFRRDCENTPEACTIPDSNRYTHDLGEGETETVTVREDGVVVQKNTQTDTVTIVQNGQEFPLPSTLYDSLLLEEEGTTITIAENSLTFIAGDSTRTITRYGWGLGLSGEEPEDTTYYVGDERIDPDGDGNWVFQGETYTGSPIIDNGLVLGQGNRRVDITRLSDSLGGYTSVLVTDGKEATRTDIYDDGQRTIERREDNKITSRVHDVLSEDNQRRRVWEDQFDDGQFQQRVFYDEHGRLSGWCDTGPTQCSDQEITFNWDGQNNDGEDCGIGDEECYSRGAFQVSNLDQVPDEFEDQLEADPFGDIDVESVLSGIVGHPVSFYPLANELGWFKDYVQFWDSVFARNVLRIEPLTSLLCEADFDVDPTEGIGIIRTPQGTFQAAAHVAAERISVGILICDDEGTCPADLECREDEFCYEESSAAPKEGYLYKIDWGVTAPYDAGRIGASGAGEEIKFNLVAYKGSVPIFLFADAAGRSSEETLSLEKGGSSAATYAPLIVEYSPELFTRICIEWSDDEEFVPQTESLELFGSFGLEPLSDICSDIAETQPGRTLESATDPTGVSQSRQVRYCTLSGCG